MLNALKKLFSVGNTSEDDNHHSEASSSSDEATDTHSFVVSETVFQRALNAIELFGNADFLLTLPSHQLSYRIKQGQHQGKSYLWLLANDAVKGNSGPFSSIFETVNLNDLRTKPIQGVDKNKTVLWLISYAAFNHHEKSIIIAILRKFGLQLSDDDLNTFALGYSVKDLLNLIAVGNSEIANLISNLSINDNHADDDSCNSAGTLLGDKNESTSSDSCRSAGTLIGDDDDNNNDTVVATNSYREPIQNEFTPLRMSSSQSQSPRLRAWKKRQMELESKGFSPMQQPATPESQVALINHSKRSMLK